MSRCLSEWCKKNKDAVELRLYVRAMDMFCMVHQRFILQGVLYEALNVYNECNCTFDVQKPLGMELAARNLFVWLCLSWAGVNQPPTDLRFKHMLSAVMQTFINNSAFLLDNVRFLCSRQFCPPDSLLRCCWEIWELDESERNKKKITRDVEGQWNALPRKNDWRRVKRQERRVTGSKVITCRKNRM